MKYCDPRHPEYHPSWGGHTGDMSLNSICPFFNNVVIHRTMGRTVAQFSNGEWLEIRDDKSPKCCSKHEQQAELLRIAKDPRAIQTHPFPVLSMENLDPMGKAFLSARKLAKR